MKTIPLIQLMTFLLFTLFPSKTQADKVPEIDSLWGPAFYIILNFELESMEFHHHSIHKNLSKEMEKVKVILNQKKRIKKKIYWKALERKIDLQEKIDRNAKILEYKQLKVRYRKGIELIKLLYEKILGLDHHFTGMQTFQDISTLSNPHTYPEFRKAKDLLKQDANRRYSMGLPAILQTNPYVSATFTLVSTLLSNNNKEEKEKKFGDIACILDFTVRMNADLNVIRHETQFLKRANQALKLECETLFEDYTKVVNYLVPLEKCRTNDDWECLQELLDNYIFNMEQDILTNPLPDAMNKDRVNLEFATQRVADFISKYSDFVVSGNQYYEKFDSIISSYQNENTCQEQLPTQFKQLKRDIESTIEKFNNTFNLPEIQGTRLKNLLYGGAGY